MELLDVGYYRGLGMSIEQIRSIYDQCDEEQLMHLLHQKRLETEKKIRYEQQLLKRIEHVESIAAKIQEMGESIDIQTFPQSDILFEQREDSLNRYLEEVLGMDHDRYIFCQLAREFPLWDTPLGKKLNPQSVRTMLLLNRETAKQLGQQQAQNTIPQMTALHSIVRLKNADFREENVAPMLRFAQKEGICLQNKLLMTEIPMISYTNLDHYYAELFIPLEEEDQPAMTNPSSARK